MPKAKKQHYVPQFYLKRFTQDGKQLFVFDKFARTTFKSNISNVASERYFYDIPHGIAAEDVDPQSVEKVLSNIEADFSNVIEDVLRTADGRERIDCDQKLAMAFFITIQILRTQEFRSLYTELVEKGAKAVLDKIVQVKMSDVSPDEYRVQFNQKTASLEQAKFMFNPAILNGLVQVLNNHIWIVGTNETTQPLYTSDSPVVKRAHKKHPFVSCSGLASEGIEIAFPITPKHVLILCERTLFRHYAKWDCKSMSLDADNVTYYNCLQVFQSYRQLYCPSNEFSLAEGICNEHPEVCTPDRTRIQVV